MYTLEVSLSQVALKAKLLMKVLATNLCHHSTQKTIY